MRHLRLGIGFVAIEVKVFFEASAWNFGRPQDYHQ